MADRAQPGSEHLLQAQSPAAFGSFELDRTTGAVKVTPAGRGVTFSAAQAEHGAFCFNLMDAGIGMTAKEIVRALKPVQQIDNSLARRYEGTGFGFTLSKSLVELHGGNLVNESQPGQGIIVTVRLPAARVVSTVR